MEKLNELIHKIHSSLSDQAFLEIFEFIKSIYPDEREDSRAKNNKIKYNQYHSSAIMTLPGCAKVPLLELHSDFNA